MKTLFDNVKLDILANSTNMPSSVSVAFRISSRTSFIRTEMIGL